MTTNTKDPMTPSTEIPPLAPGQKLPTPRVQRTHVALYVRDPVVSGRWYAQVLGMEQVEPGGLDGLHPEKDAQQAA